MLTDVRRRAGWYSFVLLMLAATGCSPANVQNEESNPTEHGDVQSDAHQTTTTPSNVRVATFNASLYRDANGQLVDDLKGGDDEQAAAIAQTLQIVRPDIVLINEFDWDEDGEAAKIFEEGYLSQPHGAASGLDFPYRYVPRTNTGVHSGVDLNQDGRTVSTPGRDGYGDDAFGFGQFPGQYGMVIYSKFPIDTDGIRSFRTLRWRTMPDNLLPSGWYTDRATELLRLSSKNHVDVPVDIGSRSLHLLASHPTPPSFDGPEDRNGRRNHDEIRFWTDYISRGETSSYIRDDSGNDGGLGKGDSFVVLGDLNSDPRDGDSRHEAIRSLIDHPRVQDPKPRSIGARKKSERDGQANTSHNGDPALDTTDFSDKRVGNLRVDYVLPSADLSVEDSGVFWPTPGDDHAELLSASDHRLVWVDIRLDSE
jgi:hypothetical protein